MHGLKKREVDIKSEEPESEPLQLFITGDGVGLPDVARMVAKSFFIPIFHFKEEGVKQNKKRYKFDIPYNISKQIFNRSTPIVSY